MENAGNNQILELNGVAMFLTTAMDDTNLTSIRRSIFLYASFIVAVWWLSPTFGTEGTLFNVIQLPPGTTVEGSTLIWVAGIFQIYLVIRLLYARPIALAKLQKSWGLDELKHDSQFVRNAQRLENIVERAQQHEYPGENIDRKIIEDLKVFSEEIKLSEESNQQIQNLLAQLKDEIASVGTSLESTEREVKDYVKLVTKGSVAERMAADDPDNLYERPKEITELGDGFDSSSPNEHFAPRLVELLKSLKTKFEDGLMITKIQNLQSNFEKSMNDSASRIRDVTTKLEFFGDHVVYLSNFQPSFSHTELAQVIDKMSSDLVAMRTRREREFFWFEIAVPTLVAAGCWCLIIYGQFGSTSEIATAVSNL